MAALIQGSAIVDYENTATRRNQHYLNNLVELIIFLKKVASTNEVDM